jgi:ABC-type sugar transport system substrate-binding protein
MKRSAGGVFLALVFLLSVWGSAFGEMNPMVAESIATIESQLGQIPSDGGGKRIGVLVITLSNPYWTEMKKRYEEWASEMNVSVEILAAPTEGDLKSQLETLETMVVKGYDAIIVTPMDPFNLIPGVLKANEKGIPVICSGPAIDAKALKDAGGRLDGWISATIPRPGDGSRRKIW